MEQDMEKQVYRIPKKISEYQLKGKKVWKHLKLGMMMRGRRRNTENYNYGSQLNKHQLNKIPI